MKNLTPELIAKAKAAKTMPTSVRYILSCFIVASGG